MHDPLKTSVELFHSGCFTSAGRDRGLNVWNMRVKPTC